MYGDLQSPGSEGAYAYYEENRFASGNDGLFAYSHKECSLPEHEVSGDVIIHDQCARPQGDMLYSSNLDQSKIIPHRVQPNSPPVKPYGPAYSYDLLYSTWPWFSRK